MASSLDFPSTPANGFIHTDSLGQRWQYDSTFNAWTPMGGPVGYTGTVVVGTKTLTFADGILRGVA